MAGGTYVQSACSQRAAAISYHVLFSLVPFLALLLSVLELLLPQTTHERVVEWLVDAVPLPADVGTSVEGAIEQAGSPASAAGAVALIGFVWAASGMMAAMRSAFRAVWGSDSDRPYLRGKLLDAALVLGAGLLIVTAFGLTIVVQVATETSTRVAEELGLGTRSTDGFGALAQLCASLLLALVAFVLLYRVVPPVSVRIRDVLLGAGVATFGVHLAGAGFSVYLDRFADFDDVYGPLGAVLAFLLLVYITAIVLLLGACIAASWPHAAGQIEQIGPRGRCAAVCCARRAGSWPATRRADAATGRVAGGTNGASGVGTSSPASVPGRWLCGSVGGDARCGWACGGGNA